MTPSSQRLVAYACLALSMCLTGSYVALSKPLVAALPVFLLAWMRFGIAAVVMLPWLRKPADEPPMTMRTRGLLFLESFLGNFLFSICMLFGVSMTSAVSAGVVMAGVPAVIALMSWAFLRERIGSRMWLAAGCAVLGLALLAFSRSGPPTADGTWYGTQWLGNLLVFGAVLCEGFYAVIGKKLTGSLTPKRISALINLWGFTLMTPFGLYYALDFDFAGVAASTWLLLVFYALAASMGSVWLWMTGARHLPASQSGIFTVMLPISAALVGVLALGETLSGLQVLAFVIALLGIVLTWNHRPTL
ncbi:MAG: DMT family transporter [Rhodoferax sp.]|jgi:drug/metabolite transporter (DMT)-like permease|nr:DMT family transporter [Rhodoferax sp.]